MLVIFSFNKKKIFLILFLCLIIGSSIFYINILKNPIIPVHSELNDQLGIIIKQIIDTRNKAILENDTDTLEDLYNREVRNGLWAYEHELKKMKYLHAWEKKQGIYYKDIDSIVNLRSVKKKNDGYSLNLMVTTKYEYIYEDCPDTTNFFQIGTYHSLDLMPYLESTEEKTGAVEEETKSSEEEKGLSKEKNLLITREWYTDPFADSLQLEGMDNLEVKSIILAGKERDFSQINNRRKNAINYADKYCGAASLPQYKCQYNKKYRNYNYLGGDCTNFASQVLYEGGKLPKNGTWNYYRGSGSRAWVNAATFNNYMTYSGRGTLIAYGDYCNVLEASYKLSPGDYIAYEKKGEVVHISVVTGADSKGYTLVNSHNADRYRVPWDLGWSNGNIKFRLVQVHY